ncbi:hypothetical protein P7H06_20295 [Paenibacillus larvae]|nr:hypothetical protein [Paenibacillus larvae]MDT2261362.1 hypothetical protein [Paenibacillus larvae]
MIEIAPSFPKEKETRTTRVQPCLVSLCPSPYWVDTYTTSRQMSYVMGGYKFSLRLPVSFSKRSFQRGVVNEGDVETPVKLNLKGQLKILRCITEPRGNSSGLKGFKGNDILHIDTTFGKKRVEIVRASGRWRMRFTTSISPAPFFNWCRVQIHWNTTATTIAQRQELRLRIKTDTWGCKDGAYQTHRHGF